MRRYSREYVAAVVDHTLLKPEATKADIVALLQEAEELEVFAVCVSPTMVSTAKSFRTGEYDIASVVGFPSGKHLWRSRLKRPGGPSRRAPTRSTW